ncbi:ATP-binding cassette domain-containing protein [Anoxynatronum buryatiense]|uniref:Monosaccharide ABC transporter ATP-binding protein, CUT2 family n=1 Tax=Anoxynatronum buryatiense TaxID=489973 RepID=A0AA45WXB7_9CLOT|nr:ATP-binding cassette domain-containing protein [Anoxynatronum buryatiense]SMP63440.1 monosaccharide ABC transporter ATP-binding protein, CUT2 family [Anoxynatronum buryatiense]
MPMMKEEILRVENVTSRIDGITYLDNINFHVFKGEIMGLIPLNNHGKKQLIELIAQNKSIKFGRIYFNETLVNYYEHSNMTNNKVYVIDKETKLIESLKVTDNINVLNNQFNEHIIHEKKLQEKTDQLLKEMGVKIRANEYISALSMFEKTIIELIKALITGAQLIILNELASFLSIEELGVFQELMLPYARKGTAFIYIANHHEEAFKICDRVCLLENGSVIKVIDQKDFSVETIQPYIIAFDRHSSTHESKSFQGIFECHHFKTEHLNDISFSVRRGECVTLLDVNNKGIQDIAEILQGSFQPISGELLLDGQRIDPISVGNLLENKVVFIPENPVKNMLFYHMSYLENVTFLMDYKLKTYVIPKRVLKSIKEEYHLLMGNDIDVKDIRTLDAKSLYQLAYYRVEIFNPKVVFIMQPFADADMYLRGSIVKLINRLKNKGSAVIILAVNIADTLTVSDRLLMMENGVFLKNYDKSELSHVRL